MFQLISRTIKRKISRIVVGLVGLGSVWSAGGGLEADESDPAQLSTRLHLAYVRTGHAASDGLADAGLRGLSMVLHQRTSVQDAAVTGVDIESAPLAFFPLLYWIITPETAHSLTPTAQNRLHDYLRNGGMVVFDRRQAAGFSSSHLDNLASWLPTLTTVAAGHAMTRSFYILESFPGRRQGGEVWVEAEPSNNQDRVSAVVVGSNDWIGAWAIDQRQQPLLPIVGGGERQREMARRFGVNLVMYALTGNYKTDQIHQAEVLRQPADDN